MHNWAKELRKWLGAERLQPVVLTQSKDEEQKVQDFKLGAIHRVLIASYESLRKHSEKLAGTASILVCDEGHRCIETRILQPTSVSVLLDPRNCHANASCTAVLLFLKRNPF